MPRNDGQSAEIRCRFCGKSWYNNSVQRLEEHMKGCRNLPVDRYSRYDRVASTFESRKRPRVDGEITEYCTMTPRDQARCDELLAEAIYSSGVAFNFVENPAFRKFLQHLRPAYKPPTRWKLANSMLDDAYDRTKKDMDVLLNKAGRQITLVSDGWTNVRTESVINYVAVTRKNAIFLKSEVPGSKRPTGDMIVDGLKKAVEEVGRDKVVAVVTDNVANMKSSWAEVGKAFPEVLTAGCASHTVKLAVDDVFEITAIGGLYQQIKDLTKYFKTSTILTGLLNDAAKAAGSKRRALSLPSKTRWQGRLYCAEALVDNKDFIKTALSNERACFGDKPSKERQAKFRKMRALALDYVFWEKVDVLIKFLQPFLEVTIALESTQPKASRIYAYFRYLVNSTVYTTALDVEQVHEVIGKRFAQVHKPVYIIAYICDPSARRDRQVEVTGGMKDEMANWLLQYFNNDVERAGAVYKELLDCWDRTGVFENSIRWASHSQYPDLGDWWEKQHCSDDLKKLAIYSLSINPTTGAAERNWSIHGFLHSQSRNRLLNPRVEKLVYVYQNLRVRDKILSEEPLYFDTSEVDVELLDAEHDMDMPAEVEVGKLEDAEVFT